MACSAKPPPLDNAPITIRAISEKTPPYRYPNDSCSLTISLFTYEQIFASMQLVCLFTVD